MPSNFLNIDTRFPTFTGGESTEQKVAVIQNYLFLLVEQLRYSLRNIDLSNMNEAGVTEFAHLITKPLIVRIEDDEGQLAQLIVDTRGIATRVESAEGDISVLQQTASSLTFTVSQNGNVISYRLGANGGTISSTDAIELYSLDGLNPPVGKTAQGVIVNANGQSVLEHGWYNAWGNWDGLAVYCCTSYNSGTSWGSVLLKQGVKGDDGDPGADGLTVLLNNNPYTFAGSTSAALAGSTTVGVIAFLGSTRQAATIGTITGQPTGMTTSVTNNGTSSAGFTVNVTTSLTQQSGTLTVPVTVGSTTVNLLWSWSVAYKGEQGQQGQQGPPGSDANVTFTNVNNALASLFALVAGGTQVEITGGGVYAPVLRGGEIYGSKIYAGSGNGYAQMSQNGLDVKDPAGDSKLGTGYTAITAGNVTTYYPFLKLGVGSSDLSSNAGLVYKLGSGIWIGDSSIVAAGGQYPGGGSTVADISASYPYATGIFIDMNNDLIYKYINGVPTEMTTAVFA